MKYENNEYGKYFLIPIVSQSWGESGIHSQKKSPFIMSPGLSRIWRSKSGSGAAGRAQSS